MTTHTALAVALLLLPPAVQAQLEVQVRHEEISEVGMVDRLVVSTAGLRAAFNPPRGWARQVDSASDRVVLRSNLAEAGITFRFFTGTTAPPLPLDERLAELWPSAVLRDRAPCHARNVQGTSLDFTLESGSGGPSLFHGRIARFSQSQGTIEISLIAPEAQFRGLEGIWIGTLNSLEILHAEPNRTEQAITKTTKAAKAATTTKAFQNR